MNCSQLISYAKHNLVALISIICSKMLQEKLRSHITKIFVKNYLSIVNKHCNLQCTSDDLQMKQIGSKNYKLAFTFSIHSCNYMQICLWTNSELNLDKMNS